MDSTEFIDALNQIEKEKGIDKEIIFEAIESSLVFSLTTSSLMRYSLAFPTAPYIIDV